ncbi:MAG: hypothetical protein JXR37_14415 [Kiritimatiellae bacterium]|nr:hypothetical protein [Kiritimatiellia bacterium]
MILEPFGMGDIISLEPLIKSLSRNGVDVRVCAQAAWRPLLPREYVGHWIDAVVPWATADPREKYRLSHFVSETFRRFVFRDLAPHGADAIGIDSRGDIRSVVLLYLAGCSEVWTLSRYIGTDLPMPAIAATILPYRDDRRRWQLSLEFIRAFGAKADAQITGPNLDHLLAPDSVLKKRAIALIPCAPWEGRLWQPVKWRAVIHELHREGRRTVGLCGPRQMRYAEQALGRETEIRECMSVGDWAAALSHASAAIGVDTGPTHLASCLGLPVVALFGPGCLPLWAPAGTRTRIVQHQAQCACAPCHQLRFHAQCGAKCMALIEVDEVMNALSAALAETDGVGQG